MPAKFDIKISALLFYAVSMEPRRGGAVSSQCRAGRQTGRILLMQKHGSRGPYGNAECGKRLAGRLAAGCMSGDFGLLTCSRKSLCAAGRGSRSREMKEPYAAPEPQVIDPWYTVAAHQLH